MKEGQIKVQYIHHVGDDLTVVNAARISFGKQSGVLDEKDQKLINYLAKHKHFTPFEHSYASVIVECPLYIRSQIHRHRTFSYNEVSRRYTADDLEFYIPPIDDIRAQSKNNKQGSEGTIAEDDAKQVQTLMKIMIETAEDAFNDMINMGIAREQARAILPQNLMTKFYMSGNLRNWVHFLKLRLDPHAQKECRMVAQQCHDILDKYFPISMKALMEAV